MSINNKKRLAFAEYSADIKTFEIFGNKEGLPKIKGVIPAPDINHTSEEEREKTFKKVLDNITIEGFYIIKTQRIRNMAFDKKRQKTTLSVEYRPCKNEEEIKLVAERIRKILGLMAINEAKP